MKIELYRVGQVQMHDGIYKFDIKNDEIVMFCDHNNRIPIKIKEWDNIYIDDIPITTIQKRADLEVLKHMARIEGDIAVIKSVINLAKVFLDYGHTYLDELSNFHTDEERDRYRWRLINRYQNLKDYLKNDYEKRTWEKDWIDLKKEEEK